MLCHLLPFVASLALAEEAAPPAAPARPPMVDVGLATGARATSDSALLVGNEGYSQLPGAPFATHDADAFFQFLRVSRGLSSSRLRVLNDATASEIRSGLRRATSRVRKGGTLWIYFAGHGALADDGRRVLLGVDADGSRLDAASIALDEIIAQATRSRAAQVVVILDASFGPAGRDGQALVPGREIPVAPFAGVENANVVVWVAATGAEPAGTYDPVRHGLFTWAALGALRGWADGALGDMPDGMVTLGEAQDYVNDVVRRLGRFQRVSLDDRAASRNWVLSEGDLEAGPSQETFQELTVQEREVTLERLMREAEERSRVDWQRVRTLAEQGTREGREALEQYVQDWEYPLLRMDWVQYVPEVREARRMLDHWGEGGPQVVANAPLPPPRSGEGAWDTGQDTGTPEAPPPLPEGRCDDLLRMEDAALAGTLGDSHVACLEARIADPKEAMTTKDKISRVLLVDAEAKKDLQRWEGLMVRHLEQIDQSDPDLCFKYTIYLSKTGPQNAEAVIRWASSALDRKDRWSGRLFEKKVYTLHRLRAEAATHLWNQAEQQYLRSRGMEDEDRAERLRGLAKEYARAWLDYAHVSEQDTQNALSMCLAAAGAMEYCQGD